MGVGVCKGVGGGVGGVRGQLPAGGIRASQGTFSSYYIFHTKNDCSSRKFIN